MREILFRGKRLDNGEWAEGFIVASRENTYPNGFEMITVDGINYDELDNYIPDFISYAVDPSTVGQYTGLKDKNGNLVFDGDILHIAKISDGLGSYYQPPLDYPVNVVVKWDLCAWMWETLCDDKRYISFPDAWCHYECEIIGNIYDNPELLEGS